MPELPEVETTRRQLEKLLKGKRILHALPDNKDRIVYDTATPRAVRRALEGARVINTGRKGKYLWLELDRKPWPVIHLGMTGNLVIVHSVGSSRAWGGLRLWSQAKHTVQKNGQPKFTRLWLEADDGTQLAIIDPRRFGRIRLVNDPMREGPTARLGFDALGEFPSVAKLHTILAKRRAPIKAVLLDQAIFAGVGNWIADEILFQAKISPHRLASTLLRAEVKRLRTRLLGIIRKAVAVNADYDRFPDSWLFHDRWGKKKDAYHSRGYEIKHDTIGGRTTAWVPALQK